MHWYASYRTGGSTVMHVFKRRRTPSLPRPSSSIAAIVMRWKSDRCREIRKESCSTSETSGGSGRNHRSSNARTRRLGGVEHKLENLTTGAAVTVETNPGNRRVAEYLILAVTPADSVSAVGYSTQQRTDHYHFGDNVSGKPVDGSLDAARRYGPDRRQRCW